MAGDGGAWLREQSLILAQNNHTGVPFWLDLPLWEWPGWIRANNNAVRRKEQAETPRRPVGQPPPEGRLGPPGGIPFSGTLN